MRVVATSLVLSLFLMAGCKPGPTHYWYHPAKTFEQAKKDYEQCEAKTKAAEDGRNAGATAEEDRGAHYVFEGCMEGKGYLKMRDYRLPSNVRKKSCSLGGVSGR